MTTRPRSQPKTGNQLEAEFGGFFGKQGSGKSHAMWLKHLEWQKKRRLQVLCWSPKEAHDNYAVRLKCKAYTDMAELVRAARHGRNVVYIPSCDRDRDWPEFDLFNRLAHALAPCELLVDELSFVTSAQGGTKAWSLTCRIKRADGVRVLASTQRPAHVDKEFYGGLTYAHVGALNYPEDAKTAATLVRAKPDDVFALTGYQALTRTM